MPFIVIITVKKQYTCTDMVNWFGYRLHSGSLYLPKGNDLMPFLSNYQAN